MTYPYIAGDIYRIVNQNQNQTQNQAGPRKYVFVNNSATSRYSGYRNLAIIECDPDHTPKMIRETRKGNARIIEAVYDIHIGSSEKSEGYRIAREMMAEVAKLNGREKSMEEEA